VNFRFNFYRFPLTEPPWKEYFIERLASMGQDLDPAAYFGPDSPFDLSLNYKPPDVVAKETNEMKESGAKHNWMHIHTGFVAFMAKSMGKGLGQLYLTIVRQRRIFFFAI
jgi:hypothetical protein